MGLEYLGLMDQERMGSENMVRLFIHTVELKFVLFSICHISILIYCYGFYFDIIVNFEF